MRGILHLVRFLARATPFLLLIVSSGCAFKGLTSCRLPCQLGIDQTNALSVQDFLDILLEYSWIRDDPERTLQAMYAWDTFSNVLETTTSIELNGVSNPIYGSDINLYIGNVGTVELNHESVPLERLESIQVQTDIPIPLSWLLYGLPEGGRVLPFYLASDLNEINPCPDRSHYIAYHDGGNTIIRAVVKRPILINLWTTPVEIVYPIDEVLAFYSSLIGQYQRMDHSPCMPD